MSEYYYKGLNSSSGAPKKKKSSSHKNREIKSSKKVNDATEKKDQEKTKESLSSNTKETLMNTNVMDKEEKPKDVQQDNNPETVKEIFDTQPQQKDIQKNPQTSSEEQTTSSTISTTQTESSSTTANSPNTELTVAPVNEAPSRPKNASPMEKPPSVLKQSYKESIRKVNVDNQLTLATEPIASITEVVHKKIKKEMEENRPNCLTHRFVKCAEIFDSNQHDPMVHVDTDAVKVELVPRELRTERSTVPDELQKIDLKCAYIYDSVQFFMEDWKVIQCKDGNYKTNLYLQLNTTLPDLPDICYDMDINEAEPLPEKAKPLAPNILALGEYDKSKSLKKHNEEFRNILKLVDENRQDIFMCFPMVTPLDPPDQRFTGRSFSDESAYQQLMVTCNSLTFEGGNFEPFFCTMSLYNLETHQKISETFDFDVNSDYNLKSLGSFLGERDFATKARSSIFKLVPKPNIYLVITITKVIKGEADEKDLNKYYINHIKVKQKQRDKFDIETSERLQVLGGYRQLFALSIVRVCDDKGDISLSGEVSIDDLKVVKIEKNFYTTLFSILKEPKKYKVIPGKMVLNVKRQAPGLEGRIDPSYIPLKPIGEQITRELEVFEGGISPTPFSTYVSNLYFYPEVVNFRHYSKAGINARTIAIEVKLLSNDNDPDQPGLLAIYGDSSGSSMVTSKKTIVNYHNTRPIFFDEIKIRLPYDMTPTCHLLISFYHIKCEIQKKKEKETIPPETLLGRCFIPVFPNSRIISDKTNESCPIYYELYPGYLSPPKDYPVDPKIFVADGKEIFQYRTKAITTLYTQDDALARVFECESQPDDKLKVALESISEASEIALVQHMIPLLDFLFRIMTNRDWIVIELLAFDTMVNVLDRLFMVTKRDSYLESYVTYHVDNLNGLKQPLFETLPKLWMKHMAVAKESKSYRYCWFFYMVIYKSIVLYKDRVLKQMSEKKEEINNGEKEKVKEDTDEKMKDEIKKVDPNKDDIMKDEPKNIEDDKFYFPFTNSWYYELRQLVVTMSKIIQRNYSTDRELALFINLNTAYFIRDLLIPLHKGHIFSIIDKYLPIEENTKAHIIEEKWKFLVIISSHEYYVQLNNPIKFKLKPTNIGELQYYFAKKHFLAGVVLRELRFSINKSPSSRGFAIQSLRDILWRHEHDNRYKSREAKERIAQFYFPLIPIMIDHRDLLFGRSTAVTEDELRNWLICFSYVLKNVERSLLRDWWRNDAEKRKLGFLAIFVECLTTFQYIGSEAHKKRGMTHIRFTDPWQEFYKKPTKPTKVTQQASPASIYQSDPGKKKRKEETSTHLNVPLASTPTQEYLKLYFETRKFQKDRDKFKFNLKQDDVLRMEKNLSREITLLILQTILEFVQDHRKELVQNKSSELNGITDRVFRVLIECLKMTQTKELFNIIFQTVHVIVSEFSAPFFRYRNTFCIELVSEVVKECNAKFAQTRAEASSLIVLMIENNFQEMSQIARMKLQCATGVSRMFGPNLPAPTEKDLMYLKDSLKAISLYAKGHMLQLNSDRKPYGTEITELVTRLFNLIDTNIQMEQYSFDPDTKAELYYRMSLGYLDSPDLRITQLDKLAQLHERHENFETAATVKVLAAALTRKYLEILELSADYYPDEKEYTRVFPSIVDELKMPSKTELASVKDEICQGRQFTEQGYISYLVSSITNLRSAKLFETCVEVYNLILPIYRHQRDYKKQAECYMELNQLCNSVVSETETGRIFGLYYRVCFYSSNDLMKELHNKQFIYKTKPGLRIAEFKDNLRQNFEIKFGQGKVSFLSNVNTVDFNNLDNDCVYLQVMDVKPHLDEEALISRRSAYEQKNFDISSFIYEVPFTKDGGKAYTENVSKQWKRKNTINLDRKFPFVTNRIAFQEEHSVELSPIENATEIIFNKVQALRNEMVSAEINLKTLAIQLHGTLLTQVNAGPLAVAQTFLSSRKSFETEHTDKMEKVFIDFVQLLADALGRQKPLIDTHEIPIQVELERSYFEFKYEVCKLTNCSPDSFNESFLPPETTSTLSKPSVSELAQSSKKIQQPRQSRDKKDKAKKKKNVGPPKKKQSVRSPRNLPKQ